MQVRSFFCIAIIGLVLSLSTTAKANGPIPKMKVEWVPGQAIVKLKEGTYIGDSNELKSLLESEPLVQKKLAGSPTGRMLKAQYLFPSYRALKQRIDLDTKSASRQFRLKARLARYGLVEAEGVSVSELVVALSHHPDVELAEPNYLARLSFTPNDFDLPSPGTQWGLTFIDAPAAWDISQGDPSQIIAIIDSGVDLDHPDLESKIWANVNEVVGDENGDACPGICGVDDDNDGLLDEDGQGRQPGDPGYDVGYAGDDDENGFIDDLVGWDWVSTGIGFQDNDPQDDSGHGTHVAGIAAAATNNGIGLAGVCPNCVILPLKAFSASGVGSFADIAKAIDYAAAEGAAVISMSFSSVSDSSLLHEALIAAFETSVLVAAAGNDGVPREETPHFPAHYDIVLGVEAGCWANGPSTTCGTTGDVAGFSNLGYELRAPGEAIYSTFLGNSYATWSGTSMAAPFVSGAAGLVRSFNLSWPPNLVYGQLIQSLGNAHSALTSTPVPRLTAVDLEVIDSPGSCLTCDGDGIPDAGEAVALVVTLRNFGGPATGVAGVLSSSNPLVSIPSGSSDFGEITSAGYGDNQSDQFALSLDPSVANNTELVFVLQLSSDSGEPPITEELRLVAERGVNRNGILTSNEIWTNDNLYRITADLLIQPGVRLEINPGTIVEISNNSVIRVPDGSEFVAVGTASERIVFRGGETRWAGMVIDSDTVYDMNGDYLSGSIVKYAEITGMSFGGGIDMNINYVGFCIFHNNNSNNVLGVHHGGSRIESNLFFNNSGRVLPSSDIQPGGFKRNNTLVNNARGIDWDSELNVFDGCCRPEGNTLFGNWFWELEVEVDDSFLVLDFSGNYWGTTDEEIIADGIVDFGDHSGKAFAEINPTLSTPSALAPPVLAGVHLGPPNSFLEPFVEGGGATAEAPVLVGEDLVIFTLVFSKEMDTSLAPIVTFGSVSPYGDHILSGSWDPSDARVWVAESEITLFTGDGTHILSVTGALDPEGFPVPLGDYRFSFVIDTSDGISDSLAGNGGRSIIELEWLPSGVPDLAGYNVYRSEVSGGPYTNVNSALILDTNYTDHYVEPGVIHYYTFRIVNTDLLESSDSNEVAVAADDDIAPSIEHVPVTQAPADQILTVVAMITDNVGVVGASLFHRAIGATPFAEIPMVNATGNQYTANISTERMVPPGIEYYLEAYDEVGAAQSGSPEAPHAVVVADLPVVSGVSPDSGTSLGGDFVTITGFNFQATPIVRFDDMESPSVTFVSSTELVATTPPHFPFLADVEIENPNDTFGRLPGAFTFVGELVDLQLPGVALGDPFTSVQIPMDISVVDGFISADISVGFDFTVLSATGVTVGSAATGFSLSSDISSPGQVSISMAGGAPLAGGGSGNIAMLNFDVVGSFGDTTLLQFTDATLNDGAIPTTLVDGNFTVDNSFAISGSVLYYEGSGPVPGVEMDLGGSGSFSATTNDIGSYDIINIPNGTYNLVPNKVDDFSPSVIGPLDASLVLQHSSGLTTLAGFQASAANVNKSNEITAADAALILQYSVGNNSLPFTGSDGIWEFSPSLRNFVDLADDQTDQNFTALLLGDVTGNWSAEAAESDAVLAPGKGTVPAQVIAPTLSAPTGLTETIPIDIVNGGDVLGIYFVLDFDATVNQVVDIRRTSLSQSFSLATNTSVAGRLVVSMASAAALGADGAFLEIDLEVLGAAGGSTALDIVSVSLNEDLIPSLAIDGELVVVADTDGDGVGDDVDACPGFNDNLDADGDSVPDGCDLCVGDDASGDSDEDGVCSDLDVCVGDDATGDNDVDGVCDNLDLCPGFHDAQDTDGDGVADGCDLCHGDDETGDGDEDGVCADEDCDDADPTASFTDSCSVCRGDNSSCSIFFDGFESGGRDAWSVTVPN